MKKILSILVFAAVAVGCHTPSSKNKQVSLRFDWFTSMTFSGEVWAYEETAAKYNIDIKLEPGSETTDPIKLVLSGTDDVGCISVEKFLAANDKGADLVAIGVINQRSPVVFLSKAEAGIHSPKDWTGKKVGVLPGGATEYVYRSLLNKTGMQPSNFTEVTVPFDLGTFISGQYDVRPAFIYDEPVSLERQHIAFTMVEPKDYGVNYVGRVYFAKRKFVKENAELCQSLVSALAEGWNSALADPKAAIRKLKKFEPKTDTVRDLISLIKAKPYFIDKKGQTLTFNGEYWQSTVNELVNLHLIKNKYYLEMINSSYISNYYQH